MKIKNILSIILVLLLTLNSMCGIVYADDENETGYINNEEIEEEEEEETNDENNSKMNRYKHLNRYRWYIEQYTPENEEILDEELEKEKEYYEELRIQREKSEEEFELLEEEEISEYLENENKKKLTWKEYRTYALENNYSRADVEEIKKSYINKKVYVNVEKLKERPDDINETEAEIETVEVYIKTSNKEAVLKILEDSEIEEELEDGYIAEITLDTLELLYDSEYVIKIVDEYSIKDYRGQEKAIISYEYQKRNIQKEQLEVTKNEIENAKEEGEIILQDLNADTNNPFYAYFMNIDKMPRVSNIEEAYEEASSIVYMTDIDLWGTTEKWVSPNVVYDTTPSLETNIVKTPVSDCEEHAITFVAMARQLGIPAEEVRVSTGYVEINGEKFGHAWVQLYEDGVWMNVEPTSGNYVEDGKLYTSEPLGLYYFEDKTYPVIETWSYFNDEYYIDDDTKNAPTNWVITESTYSTVTDMNYGYMSFLYNIFEEIEMLVYNIIN